MKRLRRTVHLRKVTVGISIRVCLSVRLSAWNSWAPAEQIVVKLLLILKYIYRENLILLVIWTYMTNTLDEDLSEFM